MKSILLFSYWLTLSTCLAQPTSLPMTKLIGVWRSVENDLHVEITEERGRFSGQIVWFSCPKERRMGSYHDDANQDPALRSRQWLGLQTLTDLTYAGHNEWKGGFIYDPNTGRTYNAKVTLTGPNRLTVRGYWKIPWLGTNLEFERLPTGSLTKR